MHASCLQILRHCYVHVCSRHLVKDGFHSCESGIWIIDVLMLYEMKCIDVFVENRIEQAKVKVQNEANLERRKTTSQHGFGILDSANNRKIWQACKLWWLIRVRLQLMQICSYELCRCQLKIVQDVVIHLLSEHSQIFLLINTIRRAWKWYCLNNSYYAYARTLFENNQKKLTSLIQILFSVNVFYY